MEKTLIFAPLMAIIVSCQTTPVNESLKAGGQINLQTTAINKKLLTEVPINNQVLCNGNKSTSNCAETISELQSKIITISPIDIPESDKLASANWQTANTAYKQFIITHEGEPVVNLFQQLYARILLNQYGVGKGTNYSLIRYYLMQMLEGGSLDFATMAQAVAKLEGHLPTNEYTQLIKAVIIAAESQKASDVATIASLEKIDQGPNKGIINGDLKAEFFQRANKQLLTKLKNSQLSVHLNKLNALKVKAQAN